MPTHQQNPQTQSTAALQELCFLPAFTLIVFVRRRIGLRLLRPSRIVKTFILLQLYAIFGVAFMGGTVADMRIVQLFSLAFVLAGGGHYWRSWREFNRGIRLHTFSSGVSYLERGRIPRFLGTHRRTYRIVDPLFYMVVACYVLVLSVPIGLWLVLSSFSLRLFEQARYEAALDRDLDIVDGLVEADIQQQTVEFFSGGQPHDRARNRGALDQQTGIPTGVAPDIEQQIAARRRGGRQNS